MKNFTIPRIILMFLCIVALLIPMGIAYAEENINHESDDNNSIENADTLEIGVMTVGRLTDRKDVDCFKIETTSTGDIQVNFTHEADGIYAYYWYMEVLDSDNKSLLSGTLSGKNPTDFVISAVKPGIYYFKISAISGGNPLTNGFTEDPYMITVTTKCLSHPALTDWVVTKECSCSQSGERTQFCVSCNTAVVVEPLSQLEHSYTEWAIIEEAALFESGTRQKVCKSCGEVVKESFLSDATYYVIIGAGVLLILIIIIRKTRNSRRSSRYYSSGSSSSSRSYQSSEGPSSSRSSDFSGSSYPSGDYSGAYGSNSYDSSSQDDWYSRPADGVINYGGESHNVYTSDAEGYASAPYIEDAEGYKTYVDPGSVEPPFNWCDL